MKHYFLTVGVFIINSGFCFAQTYTFTYDASGNRIKREYSQYPQCKTGNTDNNNDETSGNDKGNDNLTLDYGENLPFNSENENAEAENTQKKGKGNSANTITITPNPTGGRFLIQGKMLNVQSIITVYNILGEVVFNSAFVKRNSSFDIDLSMQPKGIYMVKIISGDVVFVERIAVQ